MLEFSSKAFQILEEYKTEILWVYLLFILLRALPSVLNGQLKATITEPSKGSKHYKIATPFWQTFKKNSGIILTNMVLIITIPLIMLTSEWQKNSFYDLGLLIILVYSLFQLFFPEKYQILPNKFVFNGSVFKIDKIQKIEIWDDEWVVHPTSGKEKKVDLLFTNESFDVLLLFLQDLKKIASNSSIVIEDNFEYDKSKNEMLLLQNKKLKNAS